MMRQTLANLSTIGGVCYLIDFIAVTLGQVRHHGLRRWWRVTIGAVEREEDRIRDDT